MKRFLAPASIFLAFWTLAILLWLKSHQLFWIVNFGYIGTAVAVGMSLYLALPKTKKRRGRVLAQLLVGLYMLVFLGLIAGENMQIEGFFFYLLAGLTGGAVIHYLVAKIVGPLLFGRAWCAWSCWTAMLLDFLPYRQNRAGRLRDFGVLRYAHFIAAVGAVVIAWFVFGARGRQMMYVWFLAGNVLYYALGIALAFTLKDNRAFCKYACPIPVVQKAGSRFSLLKIAGNPSICTDCGSCTTVCPMDIRIPDYVRAGKRVLATECMLCLTCTNACASGALHVSLSFDAGVWSLLRYRE